MILAKRIVSVCLFAFLGFAVGILLHGFVADHTIGGGVGPTVFLPLLVPVLFGVLGWHPDAAKGLAIGFWVMLRIVMVYVTVIAGLIVSIIGLIHVLDAYPELNSLTAGFAVFPLPIVLGVMTWKITGKLMAPNLQRE